MFDDMMRIRESESRYLFPLPEEEHMTDDVPLISDEMDDDGQTDLTIEQPRPASPRRSRPPQKGSDSSVIRVFLLITVELCTFMVLFFCFTVLCRMAAPQLVIPNWKIAVVGLSFHAFLEGSLAWFGARPLGVVLAEKAAASH